MKKIILSVSVIVVFVGYALSQKFGSNQIKQLSSINSIQTPKIASSTPVSNNNNSSMANTTQYKDGSYVGASMDAYYGNVQVKVIVQGGKIVDVQFLDYPRDRRTSAEINSQATPYLSQEVIQAQSANVNIISGATLTSQAFIQSLQSALTQARA